MQPIDYEFDDDMDEEEPLSNTSLDGTYVCDNCGEEIVIPLDIAAGRDQEYVEDCPVCCSPSVIHVQIDNDGDVQVWAEAEQDRY
ncbi:CPXCG motif-containing cysteine-rich protein [Rhodopirellula sp. JC740]|uniref:CPXCG motif-containing cysteine-rich protein n=1 Tax=Rhodopirellula halodulae TaxID=2894198 RepID=A0ABS8NJG5_9BACT|nr:CPXCG motif-containing cysteine-rich protein [Rhodopirellula sp. JC740]MCC9642611.1 CPXCG motif-containing cysteine-rich protein [Rhodopirellula sp. JC740]